MSYAVVQDLVDYAGENEIARLSTPDGTPVGDVLPDRVQPKLDAASDLMDSYFRRRYLVPVPVTPIIRECCCAIARHMIGATALGGETVQTAYKSYLSWLAGIGDGRVNLDGAAEAGPPAGARIEERMRVFHNRGPLY